MPKPTPLPSSLRDQISFEIEFGSGRNELARRHGVSPGVVSKIARERGLFFARCVDTAVATKAHRIDMWSARIEREATLENEYMGLTDTMLFDGTPTRRERRLSYALYNLHRHHRGTYR